MLIGNFLAICAMLVTTKLRTTFFSPLRWGGTIVRPAGARGTWRGVGPRLAIPSVSVLSAHAAVYLPFFVGVFLVPL